MAGTSICGTICRRSEAVFIGDFINRPELAETLSQLGAAISGGVEDETYKWKLEKMANDLEKRNKVRNSLGKISHSDGIGFHACILCGRHVIVTDAYGTEL